MNVNDWTSIQTGFDKLQKQLEKTMKSAGLVRVPRPYIGLLCELEDFLNDTAANREVRKKMSPTNAKALNIMKQRLKKLLPEYEVEMAKWREAPGSEGEASSEEASEEGSDDEGAPAVTLLAVCCWCIRWCNAQCCGGAYLCLRRGGCCAHTRQQHASCTAPLASRQLPRHTPALQLCNFSHP